MHDHPNLTTSAIRGVIGVAVLLAALSAACGDDDDEAGPQATPSSSVVLVAEDIQFDTDTLDVSAGQEVTVTFDNRDAGVMHNFSVYEDSSAATALFQGDLITGADTTTYTFEAPQPGTYFFRCDVHPDQMTGTLIVE